MNNRKLIVTDLDGTLLRKGDCALLPHTKEVLSALEREGHVVVLASGRPIRLVNAIRAELGLHSPILCDNGATVVHPDDPSFPKREIRLDAPFILSYYNEVKDHIESALIEDDEIMIESVEDPFLHHYFPNENITHSIGPIEGYPHEGATILVMRHRPEETAFLRAKAAEYSAICRHWSGVPYSEIAVKGVDKGSGLLYLMKQLGFNADDVIAFGNGHSDLPMLSIAGHPFVMKDSDDEELKGMFPQTEKGSAEDGVALTLESLLD